MKTLFMTFCLTVLFETIASPARSQWVQTNGPFGGQVNALAISGGNIVAGTGGGIFLTSYTIFYKALIFNGLIFWVGTTVIL